jgi:hypothetical protein
MAISFMTGEVSRGQDRIVPRLNWKTQALSVAIPTFATDITCLRA